MNSLSNELQALLQTERIVFLSTIDHETNNPTSSAISWVQAPSENRVRFAVDAKSRLVLNVKSNKAIIITFFGNESVYAVSGNGKVISDALEGVPFALSCIELTIESVRDIMFYGAKIIAEPQYEKTYNKAAAENLDKQVMSAMEKA